MLLKSLRSLFTVLALPLILAMGLGLSATAYAVDDQTSQQMATATTSDADLWRAVQSGESGYTTEKGVEGGVLINVSAIEGTNIKNEYLTPAMALAVVGVFGAFLLFFLVNGPSKLSHGFSGKMVLRWTKADIWLHWLLAISCMALIFTGLNIMLGKHVLQPYVGTGIWASLIYGSKTIHDYVGPLFIISWALCVVKWMPLQTFKMYDLKWFLVVGGYINFGPFKGKHPDSGFANAGEKMWFWTLTFFGLFISVSGIMLVLPALDLPREASMAALLIHGISAIILIAFTIVHIWMATVLSEGGMECMKSGYCDENWAVQHHNLWYDEIKENGTLQYKE
ncbi:formate dehydrogenase subunit gamma [Shewanella colwelliana]|uniref:Formate dehydrogenase subunit gamma n=1 Tax=Shewanella colwelliana TaxID=23 RepID=A0A1E5ITY5_SHECO|nr:formate dehydrogenase subunit gamma [Shewanella colwelliana]MCZ4338381.1 formate dehydrogenase subunit gamma [Shewanella colwelliana]MDX1281393.1 formate dehydrogenase subunit gamma [Shewanella colwelliana]OEG74029.1 formate dehydrogenase subunit gamma [Shewanella colwelliana]GIU17180.1 formate dehydrogenase subunit gamma [Shewanella colwelliana]GIU39290.1 formate dehydrogenase subunit gamma [Shewanella colwelliana]